MILVNDVASSSTEGAIDSTVIARIRVMELLGEPLPTEMFTPPAPSTAGAVGGVGGAGGGWRRSGGGGRRGGGRTGEQEDGDGAQQRQHHHQRHATARGRGPGPAERAGGDGHQRRTVRSRSC